ncbi:hypothetical protein [Pseudoalteromonas sp. MMG012]|uniref:hypothetical protein n=1 Tax=Pseudoalteromonas sp. MMG012 TaxID=2822686 RepID=UPI001B3A5D62|nr:hypothetical protein [Pseudoalteromonas sp. MMG012]MBQ4850547.1 hypothetical protein [Pseudoalteromonas sp. MMG012]
MIVILCLLALLLVIAVLINVKASNTISRYLHRLGVWSAASLVAAAMYYAGLSASLAICVLVVSAGILSLFVSLANPTVHPS